MVSQTRLHLIYDPLCGWCYAAAPLISAAQSVLPVQLHGGGMFSGENRRKISASFRAHVLPHDRRIAEISGQVFGDGYFNGLLNNHQAWLDSTPPIAAIMAAEQLGGLGVKMLHQIQRAHYQQGLQVAQQSTLIDLAAELGIVPEVFAAELARQLSGPVDSAIQASRRLLNRHGGQGFPTLLLERDGQFERVDLSRFLGQPSAWQSWLKTL